MSEDNYLKCRCKACGNNIEFPASSAGTEIECPHCGWRTELTVQEAVEDKPQKSKLPMLLVVAGCVVVIALVAGSILVRMRSKAAAEPTAPLKVVVAPTNLPATNAAPAIPSPPAKKEKSPDDLKVSAVQLEKAKVGNLVYAVGTVTNASEFQRFGVKIELNLYSSNGKKLGVTTDYKDIIEPNREWQFRAMVLDPKTTSATVSSIKEE